MRIPDKNSIRNNILSVILLSYNSNDRIVSVYTKTKNILEPNEIPFEFIIIDDDSEDNSYGIAKKLEVEFENVFAYQLSRNYTSNYAIFAGLSKCTGDCAIFLPDDGQPSPDIIIEMYKLWEKENKIVLLNRKSRNDGIITDLCAKTFYKIMDKFADVKYPPGGTETALIDREIIEVLNNRIHPINTAYFPELLRLGYNPVYLEYNRPKTKKGKSRWSFNKKVKLAKDIFFSSSSFFIKLIFTTGLLFFFLSILLIIFFSYVRIFGNSKFWGLPVHGWTSIIVFVIFFSGLILLSLGIIAEYIWRIYEEVKDRPGYIIREKVNEILK
jgi:polyisoprenyl-phosphate glycosyltransferase